jgi:hypothetical protein
VSRPDHQHRDSAPSSLVGTTARATRANAPYRVPLFVVAGQAILLLLALTAPTFVERASDRSAAPAPPAAQASAAQQPETAPVVVVPKQLPEPQGASFAPVARSAKAGTDVEAQPPDPARTQPTVPVRSPAAATSRSRAVVAPTRAKAAAARPAPSRAAAAGAAPKAAAPKPARAAQAAAPAPAAPAAKPAPAPAAAKTRGSQRSGDDDHDDDDGDDDDDDDD